MGPLGLLIGLAAAGGVAWVVKKKSNPTVPSAMDYATAHTEATTQPATVPTGAGGGIVPNAPPVVVMATRLEASLRTLGDNYDKNLCREFQRLFGFVGKDIDGLYGPMTVAALTKVLGRPAPVQAKNRHN